MAIDLLIQFLGAIAFGLLSAGLQLDGPVAAVVVGVLLFFNFWGYFFLFEGLWHGQTPGKRAQRLRVVRSDGHPMRGTQMFVRNLLRIVDFMPAYYLVGVITMIITGKSQRLGDLAAGTMVVREAKARPLQSLVMPPPPVPVSGGPVVDVSGMNERQYQLVRSFLQRRESLGADARRQIASEVCAVVRPIVRTSDPTMPNEVLLERVAMAYQSRSS